LDFSDVSQQPAGPSLALDDYGLDTSFMATQVTMTDKSLETILNIIMNVKHLAPYVSRIMIDFEGKLGECLQDFSTYFLNTWIKGRWKPVDWAQFEQLERTNNIAESHNSQFKQKLCYGDTTFYSVVDKLFKVSANISIMLTSIFSYEPRVVPQNVLRAESFLMFLWDKLISKQINPVVFLQSVTHLKILDINEKAAFDDVDSDDDAYYIE